MDTSITTLVAAVFSFFGICFVIFKVWPDLIVERHRLYLFELRYQLFDLAKEGKLDFNHKLYRTIEESINLHIRHLHVLSISSIAAVYFAQKWHGQKFERSASSVSKKVKQSALNSEVKNELLAIVARVDAVSIICSFKRNLFLWCVIRAIVAVRVLSKKPLLKKMEAKAYQGVSPLVDSEIRFEESKVSSAAYALNS